MLTAAPSPITAAATPRPTSSPLILRAGAGIVRAGIGLAAPGGLVTGAPVLVGGRVAAAELARVAPPEAVGGRGATGAADAGAAGAGVATPRVAGGADGAAGPPAGNVGSLMVGEELGFGGRLMPTVS